MTTLRSFMLMMLLASSSAAEISEEVPDIADAAEVTAKEVRDQVRQETTSQIYERAEREITRRLLTTALLRAQSAKDLTDQIALTHKAHTERMQALLTSDEGKRLAAVLNVSSAKTFTLYLDEPILKDAEVRSHQQQAEKLVDSLKRQLETAPGGFVPPERTIEEISDLSLWASLSLARLRERDRWLQDQLAAGAPKNLDMTKIPTLEVKLGEFRRRQAELWNAADQAGSEKAEIESVQKRKEAAYAAEMERSLELTNRMLREARQDLERSKIEFNSHLKVLEEQHTLRVAELNKQMAELEAKRAITKATTEAVVQQGKNDAERVLLVQRCKDPQVQNRLAPFIGEGTWQPGDRRGKPTFNLKGPVSYTKIKASGALERNAEGLKKLYILGNATYSGQIAPGNTHPDTERPKWGYNVLPAKLSASDWDQIKEAQAMLIELGPTMVEIGMLAP